MVHNIAGRILVVDLTGRHISVESLPEEVYRQYLGGSGLAIKLLFERTDAQTQPLAPENVLAFTVGPFAGTPVPTSNRFTVAARSPHTGVWGEADCGGRWAAELKRAGFDGIVVTGRAESPVYLWVEDGQAEIRDAAHLWGQDTYQVELPGQVACIGPAGENLVTMAAVMHGGKHGRAAGRCGLGAVMGSKQLKAVAVHGTGRPSISDSRALTASLRTKIPDIRENAVGMHVNGTAGSLLTFEKLGNLPIKNWSRGSWEGAQHITGARMTETILTDTYACAACPIGCGRTVAVTDGPYAVVSGGGPEYETLGAFGSMCLIDDLPAIAKMNELCNRYGLDVISTGSTIAFAMEAQEKGLIQGGPLWGDAAAAIALVHQIAYREGELGQLLCNGVRQAAHTIGHGADAFAVHVKGLELPMHEPRVYWAAALGYATSERGACHLQGFAQVFERILPARDLGYQELLPRDQTEGKGALVAYSQNLMALFDSLKMCKFALLAGVELSDMVAWANAVTGWELTSEEALQIGERIHNLRRLFNLRLGMDPAEDTLPTRILREPRGEGAGGDLLPPLEPMLADFYLSRGWTEDGKPTRAKLRELDLESEGEAAALWHGASSPPTVTRL